MQKRILIVILVLMCGILTAQKKKTAVNSIDEQTSSIEAVAKFKLDSLLVVPPIYSAGRIYSFEKGGIISCFDSTGKILGKYDNYAEAVSKPAIVDNTLAYGTINNDIITVNALNGNQIQSIGIEDSLTTDLVLFNYQGSNELMMPKQSDSKKSLVFGTASGKLFCLDLETLQEYWRNNDAKAKIKSRPLIIENKILFARADGFIYCVDSRNGLLIWRWKETAETDFSDSQIICDGKKLYAVSKDNELYCLNFLLGKLEWKFDKIKIQDGICLSNNKNLIVKTLDKRIFVFSSESGIIIKDIKHPEMFDESFIPPIEFKGEIIFSNNGELFCINKKYKEELIYSLPKETIKSLFQIDKDKFLISSSQGTIIILQSR